jgi:translocation and assembly module TamA
LAALFALASGGRPRHGRQNRSRRQRGRADAEPTSRNGRALRKDQPLSGDSLGLLQGAQAALARINTALRSRGYYDATITATVDGRPIAEPGALDAIDARPEAEPVSFAFNVASGPLSHRRRGGPAADRASLVAGHRSRQARPGAGRSADASAILEAQDKLITELRRKAMRWPASSAMSWSTMPRAKPR